MRELIRNSETPQAVKLGIGVGARENRVHGEGPELDFIQLCGIAHRINEAFEQCAWNFYHVGLLW